MADIQVDKKLEIPILIDHSTFCWVQRCAFVHFQVKSRSTPRDRTNAHRWTQQKVEVEGDLKWSGRRKWRERGR